MIPSSCVLGVLKRPDVGTFFVRPGFFDGGAVVNTGLRELLAACVVGFTARLPSIVEARCAAVRHLAEQNLASDRLAVKLVAQCAHATCNGSRGSACGQDSRHRLFDWR